MINASSSENNKIITKVAILDSKQVFYPLKYVLEKRDIAYDEDLAVLIDPMVDDIKFPSSSKMTDSGILREIKFELSINNQLAATQERIEMLHNRKVIIVMHHNEGKIIIGCNEMPLDYLYNDDNTILPQGDNGFTISCRGNSYYSKVSI